MDIEFVLCYEQNEIKELCKFIKSNYTEFCAASKDGLSSGQKKQIIGSKLTNYSSAIKVLAEVHLVSILLKLNAETVGAVVFEPKKGKIMFLGAKFGANQERMLALLMKKSINVNILGTNLEKYSINAVLGYDKIYNKIGFTKVAEEVTISGISFVPMVYEVDQSGIENDNL